jgi:hypothetical protein
MAINATQQRLAIEETKTLQQEQQYQEIREDLKAIKEKLDSILEKP